MNNIIKRLIVIDALFLASTIAFAQALTSAPNLDIKGSLAIKYNTRTNLDGNKPKEGVSDRYDLDIVIANSAQFAGTIEVLPYVSYNFSTQQGKMTYAMDAIVVNPNNPAQRKAVGKLYGSAPIDDRNAYKFENGNLMVGVNDIGNAKGFESRFRGYALGKPPANSGSLIDKVKKEALSFTKNGVKIAVNKYDKMEFSNHILAMGPVKLYPEVNVNGSMIFDYNRNAWLFQSIQVDYQDSNRPVRDIITGTIIWNQKTGEYSFDLRLNEPPASEASVFAGPQDESAFFSSDNNVAALTGTMRYTDGKSGDTVTSSKVEINLTGNKLTKQQVMYLAKLLLLSSIVPINAE